MQLHGILDAKFFAVVVENSVKFGVSPSAEGIGEDIEVGGDPLPFPLEVAADLS